MLSHEHPRAQSGGRDGVIAGVKAACVTCVATAIPTLYAARNIPWFKANLNHTGQALVISGASIFAYFVTADKATLETAKKNTQYNRSV